MGRIHVIMVKEMSAGMEKYLFEKFQDVMFLTMHSNGCESFLVGLEQEAKGLMECVVKVLTDEMTIIINELIKGGL